MLRSPVLALASVAAAAVPSSPASAQTGTAIERRLQAIEDYVAIEQLLMRYAAALNRKDPDAYVETFTPDGSLEIRRSAGEPPFIGPFKGRAALRKQWFPDTPAAPVPGAPWGSMRHVTTNYEIDVQGSRATVRAFFMEVVSNGPNTPPGSKPPTIHAMGRYEDELVKLDGKWLFAKRAVVIDMNTKWVPDVMAAPAPPRL